MMTSATLVPRPRPSASILLVSPRNEILLLRRVKTSSSFPSAHVFPGGNIYRQDGEDLGEELEDLRFRQAAIRELFEESGILLARDNSIGRMVSLDAKEREKGRHAIHQRRVTFQHWLESQNANTELDTVSLIPFTRWTSPSHVKRRFTTQTYLYFLPIPVPPPDQSAGDAQTLDDSDIFASTTDGGIEIAEAEFRPPRQWLELAQIGEVILYPPQFYLLHLVPNFWTILRPTMEWMWGYWQSNDPNS